MPSNANSNFLTRIPEPVSTTYAPYRGVCVRTKGVNGILSTPQKQRPLGRIPSDIRPTSAQYPPYNCLITAYLRPIYGSKPRYDRDVTATSTYCYTKIKKI